MLACNKAVRIHCKAGSVSVCLVCETRGKCQDFVARYKVDGIPYAINSPFCCTSSTISVRQSRSIEDREIGKQFVPVWNFKFSFLMEMTKVFLSSQRSVFVHKSSVSKIKETELENRFSNLLRFLVHKRLPFFT